MCLGIEGYFEVIVVYIAFDCIEVNIFYYLVPSLLITKNSAILSVS